MFNDKATNIMCFCLYRSFSFKVTSKCFFTISDKYSVYLNYYMHMLFKCINITKQEKCNAFYFTI